MGKFEQRLEGGKTGENLVATFFANKYGCHVQHINGRMVEGVGPSLITQSGIIRSPDLLLFGQAGMIGGPCWVEVKTKKRWNHYNGKFSTGIDQYDWVHYRAIEDVTGLPVWIACLHLGKPLEDGRATPSGLWVQSMAMLHHWQRLEPDYSPGIDRYFFTMDKLVKFSNLEPVLDELPPHEVIGG